MSDLLWTNLLEIYRKTKESVELLQIRDADLHPDDFTRHEKEIELLGGVLGHLKVIEKEYSCNE